MGYIIWSIKTNLETKSGKKPFPILVPWEKKPWELDRGNQDAKNEHHIMKKMSKMFAVVDELFKGHF